MKKFFIRNMPILGIFLFIFFGGLFYYWEYYGRVEFLYTDVLVPIENMKNGDMVTKEAFKTIKVDAANVIEDAITDIESIKGLEVKQYIPKSNQLSPLFFDVPNLVLSESEQIFQIPNEWITSKPDTIRRKDTLVIYPIFKEVSYKDVSLVDDNEDDEVEDNELRLEEESENDAESICSVTVAYVKDSAGREVESLDVDRLVSTGTVSTIEVVITEEKIKLLKSYIQEGYVFILAYK